MIAVSNQASAAGDAWGYTEFTAWPREGKGSAEWHRTGAHYDSKESEQDAPMPGLERDAPATILRSPHSRVCWDQCESQCQLFATSRNLN